MLFTQFKPAELYIGPSYAYVFYYYKIPKTDSFQRFKEYFDINRIKDPKLKKQFGEEIVKFINKKLNEGFNPFKVRKKTTGSITILTSFQMILKELSINKSKLTHNTYALMYNRFSAFIEKENWQEIALSQFCKEKCNSFLVYMIDKKLSKKSINSTLTHMAMFWEKAMEKKLTEENPFRKIARIKNETSSKSKKDVFEPLTIVEMKLIFETLRTNDPDYLCFLAFIFYAWIRPVEITRLSIIDADIDQDFVRLNKSITKNGKSSYVQLVPQLKEMLLEYLSRHPEETGYLFSQGFVPGKSKMGSRWPYKMWMRYVVKGLGINKNMYALKHTGNIDYLLNNKGTIDLKWQQMQNRHSTSAMTEQYNRKLGAYFIDTDNIKFSML